MKCLRKSLIKRFLIIALPLLCLWILVMLHNDRFDKRNFIAQTITANKISSENLSFLVSRFADNIIISSNDLIDSLTGSNFLENKEEDELVKLFVDRLQINDNYRGLSFVDTDGQELLNVEKFKDDYKIEFEDELSKIPIENSPQNGSVFISSLSIDCENGNISDDFDSKLILHVPVFSSANKFLGTIIIDYIANDFIKLIKSSSNIGSSSSYNFSIFDKTHDDFFSLKDQFTFSGDNDVSTVSLITPDIEKQNVGFFKNKDYLITYFNIFSNLHLDNFVNNEKWVITHTYNLKELYSLKNLLGYLCSLYVLPLVFLLIGAFILASILNKLKRNEEELCVLNRIAETTTDAVVVTDTDKKILFVNNSVENCSGYSMDELKGSNPMILVSDLNNSNLLEVSKSELFESSNWNGTLWFEKKNGVIYPNNLHIFKVGDIVDDKHYVGIFSDLSNSQVRTATNKIGHKESNLVVDMLNEVIRPEEKYILLYIALDNYSSIVDLFKNQNIDILDYFTELMLPFKKSSDVIAKAGKNKVFVVLNITNIKISASDYINDMYKSLSKIMYIGGGETSFKTRIGASIYPQDTSDLTTLYKNTLIALQWSSFAGANNISFFNPEMLEKVKRERQIEYHLRMAISKKELFMVYQPQVNISTGRIVGMEALIRWNSEILGSVSPAEFIPIAEKYRMMIDLGNWILESTCNDLNYLFNQKKIDPSLRCAINISALQFDDTRFSETLYRIIQKNNLNYYNIELEITENLFLEQRQSTIDVLQDINRRGITIAIDDFGTGYSSLSYLNRIPVDKIKIDRGFIKDYPENDDGELAKILIKMSKTLNKDVLTEGAETEDQILYLKDIGCEFIQGYYYSKPLMRSNLIEYINKNIAG